MSSSSDPAQEPEAVAWLRDISGTDEYEALAVCIKGDPGAFPVFARPVSLDRDAVTKLLTVAAQQFSDIRGDWTDPREECRKGLKAINEALALIGGRT